MHSCLSRILSKNGISRSQGTLSTCCPFSKVVESIYILTSNDYELSISLVTLRIVGLFNFNHSAECIMVSLLMILIGISLMCDDDPFSYA